MKTTNFRTRVMKYAWQLRKATQQSWSICLSKAWQLYRLAKAMREKVVSFRYRKADGTIRQANGTLMNLPVGSSLKSKSAPTYKTFAYFDTDRNSFRCFKVENLISIAV